MTPEILAVKSYVERWGIEVVHGLVALRRQSHRSFIHRSPVDVSHATLSTHYPSVEVLHGRIHWPICGRDPYVLLHEFAHLLAGRETPRNSPEDMEMLAIERLSVRWLFKQGVFSNVAEEEWLAWQSGTGGTDALETLHRAQFWERYVQHQGLFQQDGTPTFKKWQTPLWNLYEARWLAREGSPGAFGGFNKRFKNL